MKQEPKSQIKIITNQKVREIPVKVYQTDDQLATSSCWNLKDQLIDCKSELRLQSCLKTCEEEKTAFD